eukprot:6193233-Pleurochrysis_carterae.AAC.1
MAAATNCQCVMLRHVTFTTQIDLSRTSTFQHSNSSSKLQYYSCSNLQHGKVVSADVANVLQV